MLSSSIKPQLFLATRKHCCNTQLRQQEINTFSSSPSPSSPPYAGPPSRRHPAGRSSLWCTPPQ
jgi:hypothetical protein